MSNTQTSSTLRRPRPRFRPVEVVGVEHLTPRLVAVVFTAAFDAFEIAAPTQHIKILIPGPGEHTVTVPVVGPDGPAWPEGRPRPAVRTYTPRRFDPAAGTLEVHFVVHGEGPASAWAQRAEPGDHLALAGPAGRMPLALDGGPWLIAGDDSALPAIGTLLDALPPDAAADVYIETVTSADGIGLAVNPGSQVTWLRRDDGGDPGSQLHQAVTAAVVSNASRVWVGCEATAVRRIRRGLLDAGRVDARSLVTRGYWRAGEPNHPDHDHGDDV